MPCHGLTCFSLKPTGIEANIVIDAFSQSKAGCRMGNLARRMPCAARCQLGLLKQYSVSAPTLMTKMVGKSDTHDATAHDDNTRLRWKVLIQCEIPSLSRFFLDRLIGHKYHGQP